MKRRIRHFSSNPNGFVLVEAVLSWTVLAIVSLTFAILFTFGFEALIHVASRKEALSNARFAINRIVQEMLPIQASDLLSIAPSRITFRDASGTNTDFHIETVGERTNLYRGEDLLAKNLDTFAVTYFDAAGAPISDYTNVAAVRRMQLDIAVKDLNSIESVSVRGEVYPRNFYYSNFQ